MNHPQEFILNNRFSEKGIGSERHGGGFVLLHCIGSQDHNGNRGRGRILFQEFDGFEPRQFFRAAFARFLGRRVRQRQAVGRQEQ